MKLIFSPFNAEIAVLRGNLMIHFINVIFRKDSTIDVKYQTVFFEIKEGL